MVGAHGLQPSQFYESAGGIAIAVIILLASKSKRCFVGLQFYLLVTLYAAIRFFIELTRVYTEAEKIGPLTHNQVICVVLFAVFGGLIVKKFLAGGDKPRPNRA
jgi:prolipoprotein diacylglyceryltransferase